MNIAWFGSDRSWWAKIRAPVRPWVPAIKSRHRSGRGCSTARTSRPATDRTRPASSPRQPPRTDRTHHRPMRLALIRSSAAASPPAAPQAAAISSGKTSACHRIGRMSGTPWAGKRTTARNEPRNANPAYGIATAAPVAARPLTERGWLEARLNARRGTGATPPARSPRREGEMDRVKMVSPPTPPLISAEASAHRHPQPRPARTTAGTATRSSRTTTGEKACPQGK